MGRSMNLYHIQDDGQSYWVESESFALAIVAWQWHVKEAWGADFTGEEQPESVHLVHDEAVIRSNHTTAPFADTDS